MINYIKQVLTTIFVLFFTLILSNNLVYAGSYGEGKYSSGTFNVGEVTPVPSNVASSDTIESIKSSENNSNSTSAAPVCEDQNPGLKTPWLYSAIAKDGNSIFLYFSDADDPVTHYALEYGTESANYTWGLTNIGSKGMRVFQVNYLQPNTKYFFRVRAGNGCATGEWSNEISLETKNFFGLKQLQIEDLSLKTNLISEPSMIGDPDKSTSNQKKVEFSGYIINIKVLDQKNDPVVGAKVSIHSDVREALTDESGVARFENIELGEHQVVVAYEGYEGKQNLQLNGEDNEIHLTIKVKKKDLVINPFFTSIMGVFVTMLTISLIFIFNVRKK